MGKAPASPKKAGAAGAVIPMGNPPMGIEAWEISRLTPYAKNSRTHSPEQIAQIVASIEEFGFTMPILVDEKGMVLAGHGRLAAAEMRNMAHVPVLVAKGWSKERKAAYVIADNRLAENAGWERQILGNELSRLSLAGFNLDVMGFAPGEIAALIAFGLKKETDPDDAPHAKPHPITQPGDLWVLGQHRVLCGDSTSRAAVERVLEGRKPHLMVTDPPYGVQYDPTWRSEKLKDGAKRASGRVANDEVADWRGAYALFPGVVAYVWHSGKFSTEVGNSLIASKFNIRAQIVWVKSNFALGRGDFHWKHEAAYYAQKQGAFEDHWRFDEEHEAAAYAVRIGESAEWEGGRKQSTVWNIDMVQNETGHGTQKPVECMRRPIVNNSKGGDLVYDPFLGTGTTVIAAQMEGRICLGLEIDPVYCDVIVERWAAFTGLEPVHEATGKTFEQLKAARHGKERKTEGSTKGGRAGNRGAAGKS